MHRLVLFLLVTGAFMTPDCNTRMLLRNTANDGHSVYFFLWQRRQNAWLDLERAKAILRFTLKRQEKVKKHQGTARLAIEQDLNPLKAKYPGRQVPSYVLEMAAELYNRRDTAAARLSNLEKMHVKAEANLRKTTDAFARADDAFRRAAINLAEIPEEWRISAIAVIADRSTGKTSVYYGPRAENRDGHCFVYPNGAFYHTRTPTP